MIIRVSTMGPLRRIAPIDEEELNVQEGSTVAEAIEAVIAKYPDLQPHRGTILAALDEEWVDAGTVLAAGGDLVLMPPVSGG